MNTGAITESSSNIFKTGTQSGKFGDNPFLQLLITQMQSQTPLDPVDNASFMTQMSQFSSMEEQKQLNENLLNLLQFQGALARLQGLSQGTAMIGREVDYVGKDGKTMKQGVVDSVRVDEKGSILVQIGKENVPLDSVVGVRAAKDAGGNDQTKK